jgi:plastocyanin
MRIKWLTVMLALVLAVALAACGGGGGGGSDVGANTDTETTEPTGGDDGSASTELTITAPAGAANTGFAETSLTAPADTAFTIAFTNDDAGIPHNVQIFEGDDTSATPVWAPPDNAMITGEDSVVYEVPALAAGSYTFNCLSHPTTMVGTLTVA